MKRKLFFVLLLALLLTCAMAQTVWAEVGDTFDDGTLRYKVTAADEVEVSALIVKLDDQGRLEIPQTVENNGTTYTVTAIGDRAFYDAGQQDFNESIKEVVFPQTLKRIGGYAFRCYPKLSGDIVLPDGIEEIGNYAFKEMSITSIHLPQNLRTLGIEAFSACKELTSIDIPGGVTVLNFRTFFECTSLKSVTLHSGLKEIGNEVFRDCGELTDVTLPEGLERIGKWGFAYCGKLTKINFPESLRTINLWGFRYCTSLTEIALNDGLETIEGSVFGGCTGLREVTLPVGLTSFNPSAFVETNCIVKTSNISFYAALSQKIEEGKALEAQGKNNFYKDVNVKLLDSEGNEIEGALIISDGYSYIVLEGGESVQLMGYTGDAPAGELTLPAQVEQNGQMYRVAAIGPSTFVKCKNITKLILPEGLERIEARAFEYCENLAVVEFPASLQSIGDNAFFECALEHVDLRASTQLQTIESSAFMYCTALQEVNLPDSVTTIGRSAFESCTELVTISMPANLQSLGETAFYSCKKLEQLIFPEDCQLEEILNGTFIGCSGLQRVELPVHIRTIAGSAFFGCNGLQTVIFPEGLQTIGPAAFYSCKALSGRLEIPESVSSIEAAAFGECTAGNIHIYGRNLLNQVPSNAFENVPQITCYDRDMYHYLRSIVGESTTVSRMYMLSEVTVAPVSDQYATGEPVTPDVTLSMEDGSETILFAKNNDYTLRYENNTEISTDESKAGIYISALPGGRLYGDEISVTFNIVSRPSVTIWYDPGEGTGERVSENIFRVMDGNTSIPLQECMFPAPEGKEFAGWSYAGTVYQPGEEIAVEAGTESLSIELTAIWKDAIYAVTVQTEGGGTASAAPASATAGTEITLATTPDNGWHFKEWQVIAGDVTISGGSFIMPAADVTIQAVFEQDDEPAPPQPVKYNITVQTEGGGEASASPASAEQGEEITLTATANRGYRFKEWQVIAGDVTISGGSFTMPAADVTIQAVFEQDDEPAPPQPVKYNITVQTEGGGTASAAFASATAGTEITLAATSDNGWHFKEWQVIAGDVTISGGSFTMPAADVTIQAVFEQDDEPAPPQPVKYNITVQTEGGGEASASPASAEQGEEITLTATANRGYRFKEWQVIAGDVTISGDGFIMPAEDVTIKAIFKKNSSGSSGSSSTTPTYGKKNLSSGGITVAGSGIHRNAQLTVTENRLHESGGCQGCAQIRQWQAQGRVMAVYDVSLSYDFRGTVTLTFPVSSKYNAKTLTVVRCLEDRADTDEVTVVDGKITVTVDRLSPIAIVDNTDSQPVENIPGTDTPDPGAGEHPSFTDGRETDWFYEDVMFVYKKGLMTGTSATTFAPNRNATRAQLAAVFYHMEGRPKAEGRSSFPDVAYGPGAAWYCDAVTWAEKNGVVSGYKDGTFGPGNPITREQLAVVFYHYAQHRGYDVTASGSLDRFADKDEISAWAQEALAWAVDSGIMNGTGDARLSPRGTATRAQLAAMLHRFIEKYETEPAASAGK